MNNLKNIVLILIIIEIILTGYLSYTEFVKSDYICLSETGCSTVRTSSYSALFGIPLGYLGFFSFIILLGIFVLVYKKKVHKKVLAVLASLGALFAIYF